MKKCTKCLEFKPASDFYARRADCIECHKAWQRAHPKSPEQSRRKNLKSLYNLTPEQFDAMIAGGCAVCGTSEDLCVDHDHNCCPGKKSCGQCIRGVLCNRHNKAEGFLRGSVEEALALAEYMRRTAVK